MNRQTQRHLRVAVWTLIVCTGLVSATADYEIDWYTIDGGGVMFSGGGDFELSGTVGQPDAGEMLGGAFTLTGGFWFAIVPGDLDGDGDVDLDDYDIFAGCLTGPDEPLPPGCDAADVDGDGDVDLFDFSAFQEAFSG